MLTVTIHITKQVKTREEAKVLVSAAKEKYAAEPGSDIKVSCSDDLKDES